MNDLRNHIPGQSLLLKLHEEQKATPKLNMLGKLFGISPLSATALPWYVGLRGEQIVGVQLDKLKTRGYTVLHSVPIGNKSSDIDHIIISPTRTVYTINTKHHEGKKVWVGKQVLINGAKTQHVRNALYESERVQKKMAELGFPKKLNLSSFLLTPSALP